MKEQLDFVLTQFRSAWRFRWVALGVAWLVCIAGWIGVSMMPDIYEASTRVYVDTTSELRRLLGDQIIEPDVNAQLAIVRESMLGREQLEQVIRETKLAQRVESPELLSEYATRLRGEINLNLASTGVQDQLYTISYLDTEREVALDVVQTLLNTFIERALEQGRQATASSRVFLQDQVDNLSERLRDLEGELADFRREHADVLTSAEGGFFGQLAAENSALDLVTGQLEDAEARRQRISEQLAQLREQGGSASAAPVGAIDPSSTEGQIRSLELRERELLLIYTENWPAVIAVREQLNTLYARRDQEQAALSSNDPATLSENTVYNDLLTRLNEVEQEIASLQTEQRRRQERLAELREQMASVPDLEMEESDLLREYEVLNRNYNNMLASLETERLTAETLESDQVGFEIFDAPSSPPSPVAPPRPLLLLGVLFGGLALAAGIAYLLAQLRPVFQDPKSLRTATGLPILGVVSRTWRDKHKLKRRAEVTSFSLATLALVVLGALILVLEATGHGLQTLLG